MRENLVCLAELKEGIQTVNDKKNNKTLESHEVLLDLIKRSREGDIKAFESIYEQFKTPIFNLAFRYTYNHAVAEDLLQDIFIKIFTHLHELKKEETFINWLYRIAINTCLSYLRSRKRLLQKSVPLNEVENTIYEKTNDMSERLMNKPLEEAIQGLPAKMKSVFLLHDVQGLKHEEIATTLRCSVGTSKSQLFKARMKIREYLKRKQIL